MSQSEALAFGLTELVRGAFSLPLFSLFVSLLVVGVVLVVVSRPRPSNARRDTVTAEAERALSTRYRAGRGALIAAAILLLVAFAAENILRGYVFNVSSITSWWRFATPVFAAAIGLGVAALVVMSGTRASEVPVVGERRTWRSFGPRVGLIGGGIVLLAIVVTTIAAGLAAYSDGGGDSAWLEIPVANAEGVDPIRLNFYGWTYGVPVLICVAVLAAVTWAVLHLNAARPYIRPETVAAERGVRRFFARDAVRIATSGMLLALAGSWRLIANGGSVSGLVIDGQNAGAAYDVMWRHAELAAAVGLCAPVLEVLAFTLLLLVLVPTRAAGVARRTQAAPEAEVVR